MKIRIKAVAYSSKHEEIYCNSNDLGINLKPAVVSKIRSHLKKFGIELNSPKDTLKFTVDPDNWFRECDEGLAKHVHKIIRKELSKKLGGSQLTRMYSIEGGLVYAFLMATGFNSKDTMFAANCKCYNAATGFALSKYPEYNPPAGRVRKTDFKKITLNQFERLRYSAADYGEEEVDGFPVTGAFDDFGTCVGVWYIGKDVGSQNANLPEGTDILSYTELDPHWPH